MTRQVLSESNDSPPPSNASSARLSVTAPCNPFFFLTPHSALTQIFSSFRCQNPYFFLALPYPDFFPFSSASKTLHYSSPFGAKTLPSTFPFPTQIFFLFVFGALTRIEVLESSSPRLLPSLSASPISEHNTGSFHSNVFARKIEERHRTGTTKAELAGKLRDVGKRNEV